MCVLALSRPSKRKQCGRNDAFRFQPSARYHFLRSLHTGAIERYRKGQKKIYKINGSYHSTTQRYCDLKNSSNLAFEIQIVVCTSANMNEK